MWMTCILSKKAPLYDPLYVEYFHNIFRILFPFWWGYHLFARNTIVRNFRFSIFGDNRKPARNFPEIFRTMTTHTFSQLICHVHNKLIISDLCILPILQEKVLLVKLMYKNQQSSIVDIKNFYHIKQIRRSPMCPCVQRKMMLKFETVEKHDILPGSRWKKIPFSSVKKNVANTVFEANSHLFMVISVCQKFSGYWICSILLYIKVLTTYFAFLSLHNQSCALTAAWGFRSS